MVFLKDKNLCKSARMAMRELRRRARAAAPGRHRPTLRPEVIEFYRRQRTVRALTELTHEGGIEGLTVSAICRSAHMARGTFYREFSGIEDLLRFGFSETFAQVFEPVRTAGQGGNSWLLGVDARLRALDSSVAERPRAAELCLVHCFSAADLSAGNDFEAAVDLLADGLRGGRETGEALLGTAYVDPPASAEDFLARAIISLTSLKLRQGKVAELRAHREELVLLAATLFLSPAEAGRHWREQRGR